VSRFLAYSRRELRVRFRAWVRLNARLVSLMTLGALVLLVVETLVIVMLLPDEMTAFKWYVLGVVHAAIIAVLGVMLWASFLAHDREAIRHVRGAWGEENTRSELERARRKRLIWGWVDSVTVEGGDIDHLIVTRAGGLVAIDSKWRNSTDPHDRENMALAARRVRLRAQGLVRTIFQRERGAHRDSSKFHQVTPLLVLWGAAQHAIPRGANLDGIEVIAGRQLIAWLRNHQGDVVDKGAAKDMLSRVEAFRAKAWETQRQ